MPYRLGVDVGGTFTDLILVDEKSGSIHTAKVPSTPADSSIGVMNGVARVWPVIFAGHWRNGPARLAAMKSLIQTGARWD